MKKIVFMLSACAFLFANISCETEEVINDIAINSKVTLTVELIYPIVLQNGKWMTSESSCRSLVNSFCMQGESWNIFNSPDASLVRGTDSSLINLTIYNEFITIDVIDYSDDWMYGEMGNSLVLEEDTFLEINDRNGNLLEKFGVESIKLKSGEYEFTPVERGITDKLGSFKVNILLQRL